MDWDYWYWCWLLYGRILGRQEGEVMHISGINDMRTLQQMKELVVAFNNLISVGLNADTTVDVESIREAVSYIDVGLDMEILKLNEHNQD
jgi:hypothetical protein